MKTNRFYPLPLLTTLLLTISLSALHAQEAAPAKPQLFYVHEDPVFADKAGEYEKLSKEFIDQHKKYGIADNWLTIQDNDHHYYTIVPIANMAALDNDPGAALREKMGKDAYADVFKAFDKCYPSHRDYLLMYLPQYSYEANQNSQTEFNYRGYDYFYYEPQNQHKLGDLLKRFKELYTNQDGKIYYNVYVSRFGNSENFVLIEDLAKDEADFKARDAANTEAFRTEFKKLFAELKPLTRRIESKTGHVRPDLSYSATK